MCLLIFAFPAAGRGIKFKFSRLFSWLGEIWYMYIFKICLFHDNTYCKEAVVGGLFLLCVCFETELHFVMQLGFELTMLPRLTSSSLPQPPKFWLVVVHHHTQLLKTVLR